MRTIPNAVIALLIIILAACGKNEKPQDNTTENILTEDTVAKSMMQGVWLDSETEELVLKIEGDSVFFADGTSLPAYFRVMGDSIELGTNTYHITKHTEHNFWFENPGGDEVRLVKRDSTDLDQPDFVRQEPQIITATEVTNLDSVVMYGGQRYHWYITVNPTRYKVVRTTYTPEGVAVENVYYDNIIHVSVFKGANKIYGHDFNKQAYSTDVPEDFLAQSILGNIRFSHVDSEGFHFNATVCIPDGERCYMVENLINFDGQMSMKLLEF